MRYLKFLSYVVAFFLVVASVLDFTHGWGEKGYVALLAAFLLIAIYRDQK